ncbi:MAG TPA: hypothetical protein VLE89_05435 [Chlamydiales bacterium]|nr:hypothetical protein [Chlamydiales bacterium]
MKKRSLGILLVVVGVVMLLASNYIKNEVAAGRLQISQGQSSVNSFNSLFSARPETEVVGRGLTSGAQSRINAGQMEADYYSQMANLLQIGGIACIVVGGIFFFLSMKKKG